VSKADEVPELEDHLLDGLRVEPGSTVDLASLPTKGSLGEVIDGLPKTERKAAAKGLLDGLKDELAESQELLYADDRHSILVVMQAMDAGGKDGTIRHVMSGVNPAGVEVVSYKRPSAEELDHSFLWRHQKDAPARGRIGIFNRSHYEEVLVARVHPDVVANQRIPAGDPTHESFWSARYRDINAWEQHLATNGTRVVKLFLHLSKEEQRQRFLSRLEVPEKLWKFEPADLAERAHWDAYQEAFAEMLEATSTEAAPWYVIPADRKYAMRALVAAILVRTITSLDLEYPEVSDEDKASYAEMQAQLEAEAPPEDDG
jgi:PPK2 family polyphosphate:nucleotide phosphotransferase